MLDLFKSVVCFRSPPSGNIPGNTPTRRRPASGRRRHSRIGVDPRVSVQVDPGTSPPEAEARGSNPLGRTSAATRQPCTVTYGAGFRVSGRPIPTDSVLAPASTAFAR